MSLRDYFRIKKTAEIKLPRLVNESWSRTLMERLKKELDSDSDVVLNAERVDWISPCGTILLADFALKRLQRNKKVSIKMPQHRETKEYIESSAV